MSNSMNEELYIESKIFDVARTNFNTVLQKLMRSIIDADQGEGTITLKVKVSMTQEAIPNYDPRIKGESRIARIPSFDHKVASSVQVKNELKGCQNTQMELVWDEDEGRFVLTPVANTEQRSIFDADFQEVMSEDQEEGKYLPGPTKLLAAHSQNETLSEFMNRPHEDDDYGYEEPED